MEFKYFTPISTNPKTVIPNFTGGVDVFSPQKNIPRIQERELTRSLSAAKGALLQFPGNVGETMPILGFNPLGFAVYSNLIIKGDSYKDNNGKVLASFGEIRLDAVLMEMDREKNIVETDVAGHDGTVIEYISSKSVKIHISGTILAQTPGVYPEAAVTELMRALNSNKALRITSWFLAMAGVYNIVVKKDSIKQEIGSQEYQKFEFDAIADQPVILKLKK